MSGPWRWAAPFLVGVAAAVTAELALGLLLYTSPGFLPALTVVLAVETGAFACGLAGAPGSPEASRSWRWLACAGSLFLAGVAALLWNVTDQAPEGWPGGMALTLFAALPMYTFGLALAGMAPPRFRSALVREQRSIGAPAALGFTAGILLFGLLLFPRGLTPVSVYMFSMLCVALAAMIEGSRSVRRPPLAPPVSSDGMFRDAGERSHATVAGEGLAPVPEAEERIPSIAEFAPDPPGGAGYGTPS